MSGKPSNRTCRGLFVAGTDTEVGKTYVAALLAKSLVATGKRVGVYKPVASGGRMIDGRCVCDDAAILWEAAGKPASVHDVCPQMFLAPLAPNTAARKEGKEVDRELLTAGLEFWSDRCDFVIVESAGGLLSPLADDCYVADLAIEMGYPALVVSANRLGTINQTLQTLLTARKYRDGLDVAAVVLNDVAVSAGDESLESNPAALRARCNVENFAHVANGAGELPGEVDWLGLFGGVAKE